MQFFCRDEDFFIGPPEAVLSEGFMEEWQEKDKDDAWNFFSKHYIWHHSTTSHYQNTIPTAEHGGGGSMWRCFFFVCPDWETGQS